EITDDGAGLDLDAIRRRAVERGLAGPDAAARLGPRELAAVLFTPGFSTSERVTNLSGRGVGLDVVKTRIEKIGGTVAIAGAAGAGTRVAITLPLTLAILPALLVTGGDAVFAIPQAHVAELVRLEDGAGGEGIEWVHAAPV